MKPRIWTWLDIMRHFNLWNFAYSLHRLNGFTWMAKQCHEADDIVAPEVAVEMEALIKELRGETERLQFKAANTRAERELWWALRAYGEPTWGKMGTEFETFWQILEPELRDRRFVSIELRRDDLLSDLLGEPHGLRTYGPQGKPSPIWSRIFDKFPSAKEECEEAVYCYALERDSACVFHSMRIAEIGLRALARRTKVKLPKGRPLEWGQWSELIREIQKKTDHIANKARAGPTKDETLDFYNGCIGQFLGFKDEFRNQVMHKRKNYDQGQAQSALSRVRDFMDKLASKIDERGRVIREQQGI